ncbi:MAG TPA: cupredoxin domain-containing protein, partial [Candidatus Eisenbacteria bacterium]|nr:cupredoxin domain-containing protein [Candidatus Eisenbacteria bacterium]
FARAPKQGARTAPRPTVTSAAALRIEIVSGAVRPERTEVPKGSTVVATVVNRDERPHSFSLAGYEDRSASISVAAGGNTVIRFLADRPGEDFAWIVDGHPAGRLSVLGSHLEEDRR